MLYHCCIFCHGNSANVAFLPYFFLEDGTIKLALRAEMSDFQQSLGWRSLLKLPLCNFNFAAVSCMTCASPIPSRGRISVSAQKTYSPPLSDDPSQSGGENTRTHSRIQICIRGAISMTEVQSPASQRGKTALPSYRPIRLICGTFQPCSIFRPVFFCTFSIISWEERSFLTLTPSLCNAVHSRITCSHLCAACLEVF